MSETLIQVDIKALGVVLQALVGPPHLFRELVAIRDLHDSPLTTLINQYNEEVERRRHGSTS